MRERKARYYDLAHTKDHARSFGGKLGKKIAKAVTKEQKKHGLMSLASMKRKS